VLFAGISVVAVIAALAVPLTAASAGVPVLPTPLYLHSQNGNYALDYASDPGTGGTAPAGATTSTTLPTGASPASATTYGAGVRGVATLPLFSLPVTGSVSSACVDVWAASDGDGNLFSVVTLGVALVRPGLAAVSLPTVKATFDGNITRVHGVVSVPDGTELPAGSSVQVAGGAADDPTDIYYDSTDMPSSVTFNPTQCAGVDVAPGGGPSPTASPTASPSPDPTPTVDPSTPTYATSTSGTSAYGEAAGEPSIGFSGPTGTAWFQGGWDTMSVKVPDSGPPVWGLATGQLASQLITLDSIGAVDRRTGRIFDSQLAGACSLTEFSDNGTTWQQSQGCGLPHGEDHQTIGAGPFISGALLPHSYADAVWYCSQANVTALCALSRDGGVTFGNGAPIYTALNCGGIHGHVKIGPDGTPYVPNGACGGKAGVAYTNDPDNLLPWPAPLLVPDSTVKADGNDPAVGIDAANRLYIGYQGGDGHAYAATRANGTWTKSIDVGAQLGIQNIEFASMTAADSGRAAFAFLGSKTGGDDQATTFPGVFDLYVSTTTDGGVTWKTVDVTPNDPVQRGTICMAGTSCLGNTRNLLDFMDVTYDQKGRVLVAFPDGCIDACATGGPNSFSKRATLAYQTGGLGLLAAFDPPPILSTTTTLTAPATARSGSSMPISAKLLASDGTALSGATVRFGFGGSAFTAVTNAAGVATATIPTGAAGNSDLTALFTGRTGFGPSQARVPVHVYDVHLTPTVSTPNPVSGSALTVTVTARKDDDTTETSWTGTPTLTTSDTHAGSLTCGAAAAGVATCSGVVLGDLGRQTLTAAATGGLLSGAVPVTVQPTGISFVSPPTSAAKDTPTTYTTAPVAGVAGALLDGYQAVQALSTNGKADTVPPPTSCTGAVCKLIVTFGKGGGTRTITVQDNSLPSRAVSTVTAIRG
jgi:hypothetical protein